MLRQALCGCKTKSQEKKKKAITGFFESQRKHMQMARMRSDQKEETLTEVIPKNLECRLYIMVFHIIKQV